MLESLDRAFFPPIRPFPLSPLAPKFSSACPPPFQSSLPEGILFSSLVVQKNYFNYHYTTIFNMLTNVARCVVLLECFMHQPNTDKTFTRT